MLIPCSGNVLWWAICCLSWCQVCKFTVWIRLRRCLKYTFYVPCWICAMFHKLLWKEIVCLYTWTLQTDGFQSSLAFASWDKIKPSGSIKTLPFFIFPCSCLKESDSYLMSSNSAALRKGEKSPIATCWHFSLYLCSGQYRVKHCSGKRCSDGISLEWKMLWNVPRAPLHKGRRTGNRYWVLEIFWSVWWVHPSSAIAWRHMI